MSETPPQQALDDETVTELFAQTDQQAIPEEFGVEVFRVLPGLRDDTDYADELLGVGVDMPESDVYVDWNRAAFPDPLEQPHVSIYGSIEDLQAATGNRIEHVGTTEQQALPSTCRQCGDRERQGGSMLCATCADDTATEQAATFSEGDAVRWSWDGEPVHGRVAAVHEDQYTPPDADEPITNEDGPVYEIDEWDDDVGAYRRGNVAKTPAALEESQKDLPPRTDANYAASVTASAWSVRELDGIAAEMDLLSRAAPTSGTVVWRSADNAITYFAELPDKYVDEIGRDAFVPPEGVYDAVTTALEWYETHPDEFDAGADDGEGIRRARQLKEHYENDEPLSPEYVVEIRAYLRRSDGQEGRAELDADVPDSKPWLDDGYTAHQLWGGDAALSWTEDLVERMERVDDTVAQAASPDAANAWQVDGPATPVTQASVAADQATADLGPTLGSVTKAGTNEIDLEALPDAYRAAIEADDFLIYGKASIEQYDRSDDPIKIEMEALQDALDRFFESEDAPGIISLYHDDIPVGVPVREHTLDEATEIQLETPDGEPETHEFAAGDTLRTHVRDGDGDGRPELWLLSNLAGDSEMSKEVRLRALEGQLNGYSVTIHRNRDRQTDTGRVVEACDLHAVTLGTSEIVKNAGSTFGVAEYQAFTPAAD